MAVKPISIRVMEERSKDIYETVVVMSKRAKQITQNRSMEQAMKEAEEFDMGALDELPPEPKEDYEEETKPATQAMNEFMDGDLKWQTLPEPEEDN
jgi:DNA-directed RNA polymerase subunit K/omega